MRRLKLANSVTFDRMEKTLQRLRRLVGPNELGSNGSSEDVSIGLVNALLGVSQPTWSDSIPAPLSSPQAQTIEWFGDKLNDSQKQAIEFCLKANHVACIHGPPGVSRSAPACPLRVAWALPSLGLSGHLGSLRPMPRYFPCSRYP
jgi:DNA polymerase alpha-associated DNA helicase A